MKMTSAQANKMIDQLKNEKEYWLKRERDGSLYRATINESPVIPDYDYDEVIDRIIDIDNATVRIKHAINLANVNTEIQVGTEHMTIDEILVSMAQKNNRKQTLNMMRSKQPVQRVNPNVYGSSGSKDPEYEYANYDIEKAEKDYDVISQEIMQMQLALDKHNQTFEFEVDI